MSANADKAAGQPSAAVPLVILFASLACSYQSREVNAASGAASFLYGSGIMSANADIFYAWNHVRGSDPEGSACERI